MRYVFMFSAVGLLSQSLFALSSNNTCLPVLSDAVEQIGILNENINGTIHTVDEIQGIVNRILDKTIPEILKKYDETVPKVTEHIESITAEVKAIRKLADERTSPGFIIGTAVGAAFAAVLFGTVTWMMTNMSVGYVKNRWFHRPPLLPIVAPGDGLPNLVTTSV